jgi:hypothetical protein
LIVPREANNMAKTGRELRELLQLLLELTDVPVRLSGSLLRSTLALLADVVSRLVEIWYGATLTIPKNEEIRFEDLDVLRPGSQYLFDFEDPENYYWILQEEDPKPTDFGGDTAEAGYPRRLKTERVARADLNMFWDPVTQEVYSVDKKFDSLGNPLQIKVNLDEIITLGSRDRFALIEFFEFFEEALLFMSLGRFDWKKIKAVKTFLSLYKRKSSVQKDTKLPKNCYQYFKRRAQRRSPKNQSNKSKK